MLPFRHASVGHLRGGMYSPLVGDSLQGDVISHPSELEDGGEEGDALWIRFSTVRNSAALKDMEHRD